jgi:hypothetical protein
MKPKLGNQDFVLGQVRLCLALGAAVFIVSTASAQTNYSLDLWTTGGGIGTSTGGVYSVACTYGQPGAGSTMSGGNYSLAGRCGASLTFANVALVGGTHYLGAIVGTPLVVSVSTLANLDYDANHDTLTIITVGSTSVSGTSVALTDGGTTITYWPGTYVGADQFTYTIADPFGSTATSTAKVTVRLGNATSTFNYISQPSGSGNVTLRGYGIPGHSYDVQRSSDLVNWTTISETDGVTAAADGIILYTDSPGSDTAFYRFAVHP